MTIVKTIALAAVIAASAATAQAATIFATSVDSYTQGGNTVIGGIDPNRLITANALGAADGNFLSLGLGGEAILSFGQSFRSPGWVLEITNGAIGDTPESVDVYLGNGGVFTFLANISNLVAVGGAGFTFPGIFDQIKLVDTSPLGRNRDGFDIDAISVSSVPLPAGGLLLVGALGAVAALRRRKA